MKINSRDKPLPQSADTINFLNPKTPKTFVQKLKEWLKNKGVKWNNQTTL
jgi:hypothetical protein